MDFLIPFINIMRKKPIKPMKAVTWQIVYTNFLTWLIWIMRNIPGRFVDEESWINICKVQIWSIFNKKDELQSLKKLQTNDCKHSNTKCVDGQFQPEFRHLRNSNYATWCSSGNLEFNLLRNNIRAIRSGITPPNNKICPCTSLMVNDASILYPIILVIF